MFRKHRQPQQQTIKQKNNAKIAEMKKTITVEKINVRWSQYLLLSFLKKLTDPMLADIICKP